jgi:2-polyprenyl-3-methyl-5-hydroxy-6-metoxy-1,4-benzoquinol methylase
VSLIDEIIVPRLRDFWVRLTLRQVHYTDRGDRLDRLYMIEDPWKLKSGKEQARYEWTNRLIAAQLGRPETIFEIGSGEGYQSEHLTQLCDQLCGIDVSRRAVHRAERRCPQARFAAGDPFAFHLPSMPQPVDLVVACEVIYYVKDPSRFIERLSQLGSACLVTYYDGQASALDPHFAALPGCRRESFRFDDTLWHAVLWRDQ